jgi:hypothetical protein
MANEIIIAVDKSQPWSFFSFFSRSCKRYSEGSLKITSRIKLKKFKCSTEVINAKNV